jgi:GntR family transcriptional regulator
MTKDLVTAEAVTQAIVHRITTGQLSPGDRLPPVRVLAEELGSNRNTVNKAYQMLAELGVIKSGDSGRQGYTVKRGALAGSRPKSELLDYFYRRSVDLAWQEMAAGIAAPEMLNLWESAIAEVFGHSKITPIFYECNDHDTVEMGRRLIEVLDMPVEYRNLTHFYDNPAGVLQTHDLIITTYHHLGEITQTISQLGYPTDKVVGIETRLAPDSMLRIARFPKNKIGVVCTNENTARMITHILTGYRSEWVIDATAVDDPERVRAVARDSDHFVVTHTSAEQVAALTGRTPDVIVNFQIDEQSVAFLNQRIHQIRREKMTRLHAEMAAPAA